MESVILQFWFIIICSGYAKNFMHILCRHDHVMCKISANHNYATNFLPEMEDRIPLEKRSFKSLCAAESIYALVYLKSL